MADAAPDLAAIDLRHHEVMHRLRADGPVVWVAALDGWVVLSRDAAVAVMRDAVGFTVDDQRFSTAQVVGPSMLSLDGSEHRRYRDPFAAAFMPSVVTSRDGAAIDAIARRSIAELRPAGRAELRRQLAGPLAVAVAAGALGLDDVPVAELLGWYDLIVAAVEGVSRGEPVADAGATAFASLASALRAAAGNSPNAAATSARASCAWPATAPPSPRTATTSPSRKARGVVPGFDDQLQPIAVGVRVEHDLRHQPECIRSEATAAIVFVRST